MMVYMYVPLTPNIPTPLVAGSDLITHNWITLLMISNTRHWSRHLRGDPLILTVPVSESAQLNTRALHLVSFPDHWPTTWEWDLVTVQHPAQLWRALPNVSEMLQAITRNYAWFTGNLVRKSWICAHRSQTEHGRVIYMSVNYKLL